MSTALERVEAALKVDLVLAAQQAAARVVEFDPATMTDADEARLADAGTIVTKAIAKIEAEKKEITQPAYHAWKQLIALVDAKAKPVLDALTKARAEYADLYRQRQRIKLEAAARAEREAREVEARAAADGVPAAVEPVVPPRGTVAGGIGKATARRGPAKFKVTDLQAAVKAYPHLFVLDEAKARVELRAARVRNPDLGATGMTGLEWWEPELTAFGAR